LSLSSELPICQHSLDLFSALDSPFRSLSFTMRDDQWARHTAAMRRLQRVMSETFGDAGVSVARRCGLHVFRMAMTFTVWREWESGNTLKDVDELEADDKSFDAALSLGFVYARHAGAVLSSMPRKGLTGKPGNHRRFFKRLPDKFRTKDALELGLELNEPEDTVKKWLKSWVDEGLLRKPKHGFYAKSPPKK
jgi:hypothetical protein